MTFSVSAFAIKEAQLPPGWLVDRLDTLAFFNPEQIGAGYPYPEIAYVDIGNVTTGVIGDPTMLSLSDAPSRAQRIVKSQDTILSTVRPGNRAYAFLQDVPDNLIVSTGFAVLRAKRETADPRFLYYLATSDPIINYLASIAEEKTAYPSVNPADIAECRVPIPSLSEQRAIAHILGTLDDKIELNRKMSETLEGIARAIFKAWFIDFEPVRAKMEGRWQQGQSLPGLPSHLYHLFPESFDEHRIPNDWTMLPLGELCTVGRGGSPRPIHDYMGGEIPWIKIADATASTGPFLFETKEYLKREGLSKTVPVAPGDLILSNSATCGVPIFAEIHGCIHDGWLHFKDYKRISKIFLYQTLLQISEHLVHIADGSVQKNLNTSLVSKQLILVPHDSTMHAFNSLVQPMFERMKTAANESRVLSGIRDALLPKLISGEIRVKDAERLVEAVV